jgi:hypothetical protein
MDAMVRGEDLTSPPVKMLTYADVLTSPPVKH